jgi:amino acid transporter
MSTLGWLVSVPSSTFVVTTLIEVLIDFTQPNFAFPNWHYTLIMLAVLDITIFMNTWGTSIFPMLETVSLFAHIAGFIITFVALWIMCPRTSSYDVFVHVVNHGGWSNVGASCLLSQVTVMYCNLGRHLLALSSYLCNGRLYDLTQSPTSVKLLLWFHILDIEANDTDSRRG